MFTQTPNNIAIKLWTKLLGPQPNVYKGYYPSRHETDSLLGIGTPKIQFKREDQTIDFQYNGELIQIEDNLNQHRIFLIRRQVISGDLFMSNKVDSANVLILKGECIIFQPFWDAEKPGTILADKKTGKVFARYFN